MLPPYCSMDDLLMACNTARADHTDADPEIMGIILGSIAVDLRRIASAAENFNFVKVGEVAMATTMEKAGEQVVPTNHEDFVSALTQGRKPE